MGQDPSLFGGKYFISFSATDNESGMNYFAVQEGSGEFVQTESPYVLQDQTLSGIITVKAVDKAGNVAIKSIDLRPKNPVKVNYWIWGVVAGLIILLLIAIKYRKIK